MAGCCGHNAQFDGVSKDYKRRLWLVIALNAIMFAVEMTAGHMAKSQALQADALDFFSDALTYGVSLAVIGASIKVRTMAALGKGISLLLMGVWVFGSTIYRVMYLGVPEAEIMGVVGFMALATNLASVALLVKYKDGDGNVAVMFAALGVWGSGSGWPDVIVAGIMATLFLSSAYQIIKQALVERRAVVEHAQSHA